jgi:hypothetical protein
MTLDVYSGLFGDDLDAVADHLDEAATAAAVRQASSADSVRTGSSGKARGLHSVGA